MSRADLATKVVEHLSGVLTAALGEKAKLGVHWDDCDADERRFWFHFHDPQLAHSSPRDTRATKVSLAIRAAMRTLSTIEDASPYKFYWDLRESPRATYYSDRGPKRDRFKEYDSHTWIYVLLFQG